VQNSVPRINLSTIASQCQSFYADVTRAKEGSPSQLPAPRRKSQRPNCNISQLVQNYPPLSGGYFEKLPRNKGIRGENFERPPKAVATDLRQELTAVEVSAKSYALASPAFERSQIITVIEQLKFD
jgi:hypothetical protein